MKTRSYPTPQDAEAAFYEALESANLDAMMEVWAEDEEIVCVHPGGERLSGYERVRESWARIFGAGQRLKVRLSEQVYVQGMMLSVHSLHENFAFEGEGARPPVVSTNIYVRTAGGWRMIAHHASLAPQLAQRPARELPKILH
jgi:ketosteroid isomerase-like protein